MENKIIDINKIKINIIKSVFFFAQLIKSVI